MMTTIYPAFPFSMTLPVNNHSSTGSPTNSVNLTIESGLTTLLGPNGSGKTRLLHALKTSLRTTYGGSSVRFLSAGRMGVLEQFRSDIQGTGASDANESYIGNYGNREYRKQSETVVGDFIALDKRADIRLKVESRLQGLFKKTIKLAWTQSGLKIDFKSIEAGSLPYGVGSEASGLTQLVAMLAAIYDDEIKFLLIDEPEVSLHPQLQSFILKEIKQVTGHPSVLGTKCIIISTHSPAMLSLKKIEDIPSVVFFKESHLQPTQVASTDPILTSVNLKSLLLRLSETYKIGFFAKNVLLSEGVSDEIVINTLSDLSNVNFASTGVQVIPVSGKTELVIADRLFHLIGKGCYMLADLDVLEDDAIIQYIENEKNTSAAVSAAGFASLTDLHQQVKNGLAALSSSNWADVLSIAPSIKNFVSTNSTPSLKNLRAFASYLATLPTAIINSMANPSVWIALQTKIITLLDILDEHGIVLIRKGSIEDCYLNSTIPIGSSKPLAATLEADYLIQNTPSTMQTAYEDIFKAIAKVKFLPKVDEAALLRNKLGSVLGSIDANFTEQITDEEIKNIIEQIDPELSSIFQVEKKTDPAGIYLEIKVVSVLFDSYNFTIEHRNGESLTTLIAKLPSS